MSSFHPCRQRARQQAVDCEPADPRPVFVLARPLLTTTTRLFANRQLIVELHASRTDMASWRFVAAPAHLPPARSFTRPPAVPKTSPAGNRQRPHCGGHHERRTRSASTRISLRLAGRPVKHICSALGRSEAWLMVSFLVRTRLSPGREHRPYISMIRVWASLPLRGNLGAFMRLPLN